LDYCAERGIPRSIFIGRKWRPGQEWFTDEDRLDALAWVLEKADRCPHCGISEDEWQPKLGGRFDSFVAEPVYCHTCAQVEWEYQALREDKGSHKGTTIHLRRRERAGGSPAGVTTLAGRPPGG
jgi:hypothetical protein